MNAVLLGDLSQLVLPRDLDRLRREVNTAVEHGESLTQLYEALAFDEPLALLELTAGPKAVFGAASVRAAIPLLDTMEKHMQPSSLYQGLSMVAEEAVEAVLEAAALRHPAAGWLVRLSNKVEEVPGRTHLAATTEHPAFPAICWAHARAGHYSALLGASRCGRPEPAAALLAVGEDQKAVRAAGRTLDANPGAPIVAYFSAVRGPDVDDVLIELIPRLKVHAAAALKEQLLPFPKVRRRLKTARLSMR